MKGRRGCSCAMTRVCEMRLRRHLTRMRPVPNLWPLFDALAGMPLALLRGAGSDILSAETAAEMAAAARYGLCRTS